MYTAITALIACTTAAFISTNSPKLPCSPFLFLHLSRHEHAFTDVLYADK